MVSLNKALLNPYFWGGDVRGGRLTSHDVWCLLQDISVEFHSVSGRFKFQRPTPQAIYMI